MASLLDRRRGLRLSTEDTGTTCWHFHRCRLVARGDHPCCCDRAGALESRSDSPAYRGQAHQGDAAGSNAASPITPATAATRAAGRAEAGAKACAEARAKAAATRAAAEGHSKASTLARCAFRCSKSRSAAVESSAGTGTNTIAGDTGTGCLRQTLTCAACPRVHGAHD